MQYLVMQPPPPLDRFVEQFWYWKGDAPGYAKDAIMASRSMALLINLKDDELCWYDGEAYGRRNRLKGIVICGTHAGHFAIDAHQPEMMGVQFKPGGAFPFFGPGGGEFHNRHISLEDVAGAGAHRLHMRLVETPEPAMKLRLLRDALLNGAPRVLAWHPAVSHALAAFEPAPHRVRVAQVAREADVSHRRFIAMFTSEVGLTPKTYLRIARFQRVLKRVWQMPDVDWAEIAARHGYYDQPHFIREFRGFSGFTPAAYFAVRGPYRGHVPLSV